ncbi:nitrilase-related carbon-nitrogen hydrolase [Aureimonas psammosilenae]|uniref:nitrilase-related carbon-nitrogen hydrolase n=1 Tax=Aureimonas psammosilenae TaxID=2495496 RepID=UPI00126127A0|nr:nitrilase-related carbon-nitrogen hydrolase [Aureimonas psammosilenae]
MQVRALQMPAEDTDAAARLAAMRWFVIDAASDGADVVVFPELAPTGYGVGDPLRDAAEAEDGATIAEIKRLSEEQGVTVVFGLAVRARSGVVNAAVVTQPGRPTIVYAKQHLFGAYEKALFAPGTQASPIFEVAGRKAGVLICFDVEFPERVRELAMAGAEIIFVPTALPDGPASRFIAECVVPVRAFENHVFIVYVNHVGRDGRYGYQGLSCIAAPDGTRIAVAPDNRVGVIEATIDGSDYAASVETNPYLDELRAYAVRRGESVTAKDLEGPIWAR